MTGNICYLSGHATAKDDGTLIIGRVGTVMNMKQGKQAAQQVGLALLATPKHNPGSFN